MNAVLSFEVVLAAGQAEWVEPVSVVLVVAITLGFMVLVGWMVLKFLRSFDGRAGSALQRLYDGIEIHEEPEEGDVLLVFHTYHGFLVWFEQQEHRVIAPAEDAELLLGRLHGFNMVWGLFSAWGWLIPVMSWFNYWAQKRSIQKQVESGEILEVSVED